MKKNETKAAANKPQEAKKIDIAPIMKKLPEAVTPKNLDELFGLGDGGKTVRRHLRSKFTDKSKHEAKADWSWTKKDPILTEIVTYFAERYQVPEPKPQADAKQEVAAVKEEKVG